MDNICKSTLFALYKCYVHVLTVIFAILDHSPTRRMITGLPIIALCIFAPWRAVFDCRRREVNLSGSCYESRMAAAAVISLSIWPGT